VRKERGPQNSWSMIRPPGTDAIRVETHGRNGLHAQNKGIRGHISRIRIGVFLPQLAEEVLLARHAVVVDSEITLKEKMNGSRCGTVSNRCRLDH
jgi:hypothetical protein